VSRIDRFAKVPVFSAEVKAFDGSDVFLSMDPSRRSLLKSSGAVFGASIITSQMAGASPVPLHAESSSPRPVRLSFNENPYGPSPDVTEAVQREMNRINRYADSQAALDLTKQIATYEHVPVNRWFLARSWKF